MKTNDKLRKPKANKKCMFENSCCYKKDQQNKKKNDVEIRIRPQGGNLMQNPQFYNATGPRKTKEN